MDYTVSYTRTGRAIMPHSTPRDMTVYAADDDKAVAFVREHHLRDGYTAAVYAPGPDGRPSRLVWTQP